jgi:hypothetical protein
VRDGKPGGARPSGPGASARPGLASVPDRGAEVEADNLILAVEIRTFRIDPPHPPQRSPAKHARDRIRVVRIHMREDFQLGRGKRAAVAAKHDIGAFHPADLAEPRDQMGPLDIQCVKLEIAEAGIAGGGGMPREAAGDQALIPAD